MFLKARLKQFSNQVLNVFIYNLFNILYILKHLFFTNRDGKHEVEIYCLTLQKRIVCFFLKYNHAMFRKKALKFYEVCNREKSRRSTLAILIHFALVQKPTN